MNAGDADAAPGLATKIPTDAWNDFLWEGHLGAGAGTE